MSAGGGPRGQAALSVLGSPPHIGAGRLPSGESPLCFPQDLVSGQGLLWTCLLSSQEPAPTPPHSGSVSRAGCAETVPANCAAARLWPITF